MRLKHWFAGLAAAATVSLAASSASAFDHKRWDPSVAPEVVHHRVYRPHYHHVYHLSTIRDPYEYQWKRRAYYPYFFSQYWVPAAEMRYRYRYSYHGPKYRFQESWGMPRAHARKHVHKHHKYVPTK